MSLLAVVCLYDKTMPIILTLNYRYQPQQQQWFNKEFTSFEDLFKWLREDSILLLKEADLTEKSLHKKLILTKLALPKIRILILCEYHAKQQDSFFHYINEEDLDNVIREAIVNEHKPGDNRDALLEAIALLISNEQ